MAATAGRLLLLDERGQGFYVQVAARFGRAVGEPYALGLEPFLLAAGLVGGRPTPSRDVACRRHQAPAGRSGRPGSVGCADQAVARRSRLALPAPHTLSNGQREWPPTPGAARPSRRCFARARPPRSAGRGHPPAPTKP